MAKKIPLDIKNKILADYKGTKLTQKEFCKRKNISLPTLHLWLRKEKRNLKPEFAFIKLELNSPNQNQDKNFAQASSTDFVLQFPSGIQLKFPPSVTSELLIDILRNFA